MKLFDVLKYGILLIMALLFMAVVLGLCYLVYGSFRESWRTRADMEAVNDG